MCRNLKVKNPGNVSPPNSHHSNSTSESKDGELANKLEREFRSLLLKMISDLKEDSNKQISEIRKSIQNLDKKVRNMEEKFSKEMEIMKNNQVEVLEMKTSINQIHTTVDSIIIR
jgi:peptidoglycan hydrolase CwlO-like protein